jgi:hypothetical protein
MTSPRVDQLVESHVEELRLQGAQHPRRRMKRRGHHSERRAFESVKSRLGSYLVEIGLRLQTTTHQSPLA